MASESDTLIGFLDTQREHVLGILEGLDEEQLRRAILPSGWSSLGMVKHLALDVEHYWFRCIVAGESKDFFAENGLDKGAWDVGPGESADSIFELYRSEIARSNEIIRATPLETPPALVEEWWGEWPVANLRFIALHVIEETACHAGHLDAVRELIDGRQWLAFN
jgi:hypothetical protein